MRAGAAKRVSIYPRLTPTTPGGPIPDIALSPTDYIRADIHEELVRSASATLSILGKGLTKERLEKALAAAEDALREGEVA